MHEAAMTTPLTEALEMSRQMLADAEAGNWEAVSAKQPQRERLLHQALDGRDNLPAPERALVEQIVTLNDRLREAATANRDELGVELSRMRQGRTATRAYQANSR